MSLRIPCGDTIARGMICVRRAEPDDALRVALRWWQNVLKKEIVEEYPWEAPCSPPVFLFVDARGVPPRRAV